jgi:hypothetical protein
MALRFPSKSLESIFRGSVSFYLIIAIGSEKDVRHTARKYGVRLRHLMHTEDRDAKGVERGIGARVPLRYHENLQHWLSRAQSHSAKSGRGG